MKKESKELQIANMNLIFNKFFFNHKSPTSHLSSLFATDILYISFTLCMDVCMWSSGLCKVHRFI